jgi:hypothetical protein
MLVLCRVGAIVVGRVIQEGSRRVRGGGRGGHPVQRMRWEVVRPESGKEGGREGGRNGERKCE